MAKLNRNARLEAVCQFLIVLANTDPLVWRRIQVPERYSFWDLHVAIQDAMGWLDYHLHEFTVVTSSTGRVKRIGIPDDEMPDERPCVAGWRIPIARYLTHGTDPVRYRYDFGDNWEHILEFEDVAISEFPKWRKYLISLSFRDKSSVRPVQVGGFEANIVVHRSTAVRGRGGPPPPWESSCRTRTGPVEADGTVDAQNAPTAPWKTLRVFHELPQGLSHRITHAKPRKAPKWRWETRIDPKMSCPMMADRTRAAWRVPAHVHRKTLGECTATQNS